MKSKSIVRQCALLEISRSGLYYTPKGESDTNLALMEKIDHAFTECPFMGVRQMRAYLKLSGCIWGIKRIRRLMRFMGLMPRYQKHGTRSP
jgi:putative transposase